ncbi:MAG: hypothetical protein HYZ37_18395 [Candidatus Solibacter usitatus]|nr:hypothetical protein [Candidatus Solibacter usitatus]
MTRLALLLSISTYAWAQLPPDPAAGGSLPVTNAHYRMDSVQLPAVAYPVDLWGTVWYPEDLDAGPYPLILFLHGNHGICRTPGTKLDAGTTLTPPLCPPGFEQTPNHLGYDYVASQLAGHGYIVVSINANAVNVRANGNPERGRLVLEHLRHWALWNSAEGAFPFGKQFSGKVNLNNIGLMGHSRGGEGIRAAYNYNRQDAAPFAIKALLEIGPVDFGRTSSLTAVTTGNATFNVDGAAFSVILPGCDGDVLDNQGMRVYDRARILAEPRSPAPKSQIYIRGANHNFTNSEWNPEDPGFQCIDFPIITDRPQQEAIAANYIMGFFRQYMGGENFPGLFTGDSAPPQSIRVPVEPSYTESPEKILLVDNFSGRGSPDTNGAGGANTISNILMKTCAGAICNDPPPAAWVHDAGVSAAKLAWPGTVLGMPLLNMRLAAEEGTASLSSYAAISFRVAEQFDTRNPITTSQDFSIRLIDAAGTNSNAVALTAYRPLLYPTGYFYRRSVLKTIRIPLADFKGVDMSKIASVQFMFDKTPTGAIFLTDVQFTP